MLVASLDRPNAERSSESNWVEELLTKTCASSGELSVASVQVGDGSPPVAVEVVPPVEPEGGRCWASQAVVGIICAVAPVAGLLSINGLDNSGVCADANPPYGWTKTVATARTITGTSRMDRMLIPFPPQCQNESRPRTRDRLNCPFVGSKGK
jgi:hypothetical protein